MISESVLVDLSPNVGYCKHRAGDQCRVGPLESIQHLAALFSDIPTHPSEADTTVVSDSRLPRAGRRVALWATASYRAAAAKCRAGSPVGPQVATPGWRPSVCRLYV